MRFIIALIVIADAITIAAIDFNIVAIAVDVNAVATTSVAIEFGSYAISIIHVEKFISTLSSRIYFK